MNAQDINFFDALEEREACREMAGTAEVVRCTYFVTSPIPSGSDRVYIAGSFRQAFEHWCQDGLFRISAIFEWKVGDEEGRGTVRYVNPGAILVRYGFVEQTIKNMITAQIADGLYYHVSKVERFRHRSDELTGQMRTEKV